MWFVIAYLLFFTIDILIETDFYVYGMMPYNALVTAVSLYTAVMLRHMRPWMNNPRQRILFWSWIVFMIILFLEHLFYIVYPSLHRWITIDLYASILDIANHIFTVWAGALFFLTWKIMRPPDRLRKWLMISAAGTMINFGICLIFSPAPVLLYRYEGVLGYVMLFGFLMAVLTIMQKKYDPDTIGAES